MARLVGRGGDHHHHSTAAPPPPTNPSSSSVTVPLHYQGNAGAVPLSADDRARQRIEQQRREREEARLREEQALVSQLETAVDLNAPPLPPPRGGARQISNGHGGHSTHVTVNGGGRRTSGTVAVGGSSGGGGGLASARVSGGGGTTAMPHDSRNDPVPVNVLRRDDKTISQRLSEKRQRVSLLVV